MPKFRKKPVEIEARQVPTFPGGELVLDFVDECINLANWCGGKSHMMVTDDEKAFDGAVMTGPYIAIETLEGTMAAQPGDWIIRGVQGEFYPCKPDIFAATYDEVTA